MSGSYLNILWELIFISILTFINAFFASAEMAIVSLNKNKINSLVESGDKKAILLQKILKEPSKFLATIQVGITLAGFFASASAATGLSVYLSKALKEFNVPYSDRLSLFIITVIISYISLVFGELLPKRIALQKSESIAMGSIRIIAFISRITSPFIKLLSSSTNLLIRTIGINCENLEQKVSEEEIKSLIQVGEENGVINPTELEMIESIFEFDDTLAKEVMTPRTDVFLIDISSDISSILHGLVEENYSRVPVYEDDTDNIIGILYMKDFFIEASQVGFDNVDVRKILRIPYFVPETKNIDQLFKELQTSQNHMAILIDEYGGFSGIVTIEDLVEEVMGKIFDEYDESDSYIKKIDNCTYLVNGSVPIDEINDCLNTDIESEHSDTIGGFVINLLGRIPEKNEKKSINYDNLIFTIESVNENRIQKIKIQLGESIAQDCSKEEEPDDK
ncbi:hemolysin family protein [Clostridium oryzae]|uniref:Magnesium and cobalt efflux protein CorC n=1 Tax=Clostridium oryzae TaxID=1450648 RepID=A0A1V4I5R2_9CLOT|nr:hemolysin family protein [Clostridium oryzae]OPJ55224.1 magnesium and cobalt efflux protein CorC [Clostridium oryzae]